MLRSKKPKVYTVAELRILIREYTTLRDSLYKNMLIDRTEYAHMTMGINALTSAKVRIHFKENQNQGRLF